MTQTCSNIAANPLCSSKEAIVINDEFPVWCSCPLLKCIVDKSCSPVKDLGHSWDYESTILRALRLKRRECFMTPDAWHVNGGLQILLLQHMFINRHAVQWNSRPDKTLRVVSVNVLPNVPMEILEGR